MRRLKLICAVLSHTQQGDLCPDPRSPAMGPWMPLCTLTNAPGGLCLNQVGPAQPPLPPTTSSVLESIRDAAALVAGGAVGVARHAVGTWRGVSPLLARPGAVRGSAARCYWRAGRCCPIYQRAERGRPGCSRLAPLRSACGRPLREHRNPFEALYPARCGIRLTVLGAPDRFQCGLAAAVFECDDPVFLPPPPHHHHVIKGDYLARGVHARAPRPHGA